MVVTMDFPNQKRILCVDDSQDNCDLLAFILSDEGYQVEIAGTVAEGTRMAQAGEFELYLIDLAFVDGSGFDLINNIRSFDASSPIVMCSGNARESVQEAARQAGVQAFLLKPVDPDMLVQTVATVLSYHLSSNP